MLELFKGKVTGQDWAFVGVVAAIIAALVVAFVFFVHGPRTRDLEGLIAKDLQVQDDLRVAREKEKNWEKLQEETERNRRLVRDFADRLPPQRDIPVLITQFEQLAKEVGLEVELKPLLSKCSA